MTFRVDQPTSTRETDDNPTLIGQLRLIREVWGEDFDEDVAKPLAFLLVKMRTNMEDFNRKHVGETEELETKLDELEKEGEENAADAGALRELREDLNDVPRGVYTLDEVLAKYEVGVA